MNSVTALYRAYRNEHLSVSRLKLYEQCPLAFYYRYVNPGPVEPRSEAALFGNVLHAALELVYGWVIESEYDGRFPFDELEAFYRDAWTTSELTGVALYQEGLAILRAYAKSHALVSHWSILAVEKEFNIEIGGGIGSGFVVNGYIDRVDKLADDWIAIVDYKSNRMLFYEDELANDLQMSIYGLVAREFWPWARRVSFVFHMLRHDLHQGTDRSAAQIDEAAGYVVALGKRTEDAQQDWAPKLNPNCGYCDSRRRCGEYREAIAGQREVAKVRDLADVAELSAAREKLHVLAKLMYARKAELDECIRARIAQEGEFTVNGYHYRSINQTHVEYPSIESVERAFGAAGVPPSIVRSRVLRIDKSAVEELRAECSDTLDGQRAVILKATLEAVADRKAMSPKLDSHKLKVNGARK